MTSLFRRKSWFECSGRAVVHRAASCRQGCEEATYLPPSLSSQKGKKKKQTKKSLKIFLFFKKHSTPKLKNQLIPKWLFECVSAIRFAGRVKQLRVKPLAAFLSVWLGLWGVFVKLLIKASVMPVGFGTSGDDSPGSVRADAASQPEFSRTSLTTRTRQTQPLGL